jgi:hypothetical protein
LLGLSGLLGLICEEASSACWGFIFCGSGSFWAKRNETRKEEEEEEKEEEEE